MKKRALVTGGAGFLGSHLCERLLTDGYDVICADNLFTGRKENIIHMMGNPYFEFIRHDITVPLYVECDEVYNLACPASPIHYQRDPVYTAKTSIFGAVNMLGLAKRTKSKIFQASTSEVYGDPEIHPQPESYWGNVNPIGIRSCYDESKRAAESFFMDYHRKYQIPVKIMRIFNTYGPRVSIHDGRVISNFIVQAMEGHPITIFGDGSQTRSFCYVDDLVEAIIRFMKTDDSFTGPLNAGNPSEISVLDLAKKIIVLTGSKSEIIFKDLPENDPTRRKPDISLARKILDWEPVVSLDDGLEKTIAYFKEVII